MPQSIIDQYAKYRNPLTNIKSQVVMGTKFEISDRYEVIDTSIHLYILNKNKKFHPSRSRGVRCGCRSQRQKG